jgi:hypothetical protein
MKSISMSGTISSWEMSIGQLSIPRTFAASERLTIQRRAARQRCPLISPPQGRVRSPRDTSSDRIRHGCATGSAAILMQIGGFANRVGSARRVAYTDASWQFALAYGGRHPYATSTGFRNAFNKVPFAPPDAYIQDRRPPVAGPWRQTDLRCTWTAGVRVRNPNKGRPPRRLLTRGRGCPGGQGTA